MGCWWYWPLGTEANQFQLGVTPLINCDGSEQGGTAEEEHKISSW
jgi:hypothetical protein